MKQKKYCRSFSLLLLMVKAELPNPGVNFINVLLKAFILVDPKSIKMTVKLSIFFTHLGSAHIKASCKTLMKLIPVYACLLRLALHIGNTYIGRNRHL